ncbi:hypothetical protein AMEX_G4314, partial [Astyanax mexicanus]
MEETAGVQISMLAQTGGTVCAPVLQGNKILGPVTLKCIIYGGSGVSSVNTAVDAGGSPVVPALTEVEMSSISISSSKDCTSISLCDGLVTVLIRPRPACGGTLVEETSRIIRDVLWVYIGHQNQNQYRTQYRTQRTMNSLIQSLIENHSMDFRGMVQKLNLEEQDDSMDFISSVAKTLFSDGTTNWGRIVCLVALGAVVCDQLKKKSRDHCVENVAQHISTYLNTHQHQWLINNNAWDGFVEFFREDDSESRVRNAL